MTSDDAWMALALELGERAALHIVERADHSFSVAARSGRTNSDAEGEVLDALAEWMLR